MALDTLQDALLIDRLNQQAWAPLTNYSQGILGIAMQNRARREQLDDEARREQMRIADEQRAEGYKVAGEQRAETRTKAEEQRKYNYELNLIDAHANSAVDVAKREQQNMTDAQKETFRQTQLQDARRRGLGEDVLPGNSPIDTIVRQNALNQGQVLMGAATQLGDYLKSTAAELGVEPKEIVQGAMSKALTDANAFDPKILAKNKIEMSAINDLMAGKPGIMDQLRKSFTKTGNTAGLSLLNTINANFQQNMAMSVASTQKTQAAREKADSTIRFLMKSVDDAKQGADPDSILRANELIGKAAIGPPPSDATAGRGGGYPDIVNPLTGGGGGGGGGGGLGGGTTVTPAPEYQPSFQTDPRLGPGNVPLADTPLGSISNWFSRQPQMSPAGPPSYLSPFGPGNIPLGFPTARGPRPPVPVYPTPTPTPAPPVPTPVPTPVLPAGVESMPFPTRPTVPFTPNVGFLMPPGAATPTQLRLQTTLNDLYASRMGLAPTAFSNALTPPNQVYPPIAAPPSPFMA